MEEQEIHNVSRWEVHVYELVRKLIIDKTCFNNKPRRTKMAAQVDTLCLLAQPELTENRTARKSNTKEKKNKHSVRLVGGTDMGSRGREDSPCCGGTETGGVWDKRGRQFDHQQTLRPCNHTDKLRGPDSEWRRTGQAEWRVAPLGPTFAHR